MHPRVYKLLTPAQWELFQSDRCFAGAPIDLSDGYIHLSTATQVVETASKHFATQDEIVLVEFEANNLGADLRWEPSRGGALFPHYYGVLVLADVSQTWTLGRDPKSGLHDFNSVGMGIVD